MNVSEVTIAGCEAEVGKLEEAIRERPGTAEATGGGDRGLERSLTGARRQSAILAEQRGREEVRSTQVTLRLENLAAQVAERYHTSLEGFEADVHSLFSTLQSVRCGRNGSPSNGAAPPSPAAARGTSTMNGRGGAGGSRRTCDRRSDRR